MLLIVVCALRAGPGARWQCRLRLHLFSVFIPLFICLRCRRHGFLPCRWLAAVLCFGAVLAGILRPVFSAASRSNGIKMNGMTRCKISKDIAGKAVIYLIDEMMFV
ncbi:hypothetical protein [Vogesella indigofera]|uniref:hypothetical protein n=1 Tax=Vogesella indigofera TaxID=45465 RepID=UPI00234E4F48|nr:hypothetical protein [Vogesella indigofera]MDC7701924.1 hypothetical protein [Vogesella indigofera]